MTPRSRGPWGAGGWERDLAPLSSWHKHKNPSWRRAVWTWSGSEGRGHPPPGPQQAAGRSGHRGFSLHPSAGPQLPTGVWNCRGISKLSEGTCLLFDLV